jgi:folate-binding protein YgfZ
MSIETELAAIRTAAAIAPLTDRAFLHITGPDATRWLNGMVTNSIQALEPGQGNYNFLLNAQGRIQGDCTIYRTGPTDAPEFILETDKHQIETIQTLLDKFIIMDDVELSRALDIDGLIPEQRGLAVLGTEAPRLLLQTIALLNQSLTTLPTSGTMLRDVADGTPFVIFAPPATTTPTYEVWCQSGLQLDLIRQNLLSLGTIQLSHEAIEAHRILSATPKYGQDIRNTETNKDLPQETAQTHALHFNKGCYLGQEIVERIRSRGQVHRTFTAFTLTGSLPELPAPLEAMLAGQTRPAGEITSAIQIGDKIHALGYLRREFATAALIYPGGIAIPSPTTTL